MRAVKASCSAFWASSPITGEDRIMAQVWGCQWLHWVLYSAGKGRRKEDYYVATYPIIGHYDPNRLHW